ncbi:lytic murein transglycosylase B [Reichenbachiella sp. MALMAid0571]|uniref:lytic murein transglycosylase B n=1 Tax=Reichenbachiella sp. MALMAid0571 TaxID=3143939 RepID=UPI0032DFA074
MPKFTKYLAVCLSLLLISFFANAQIDQVAVEAFIKDFSSRSKLTEEQVRDILGKAEYQESIIDKMNNPAESKMNWARYRNIFMKDDRILAGVSFWNENEETLKQVSNESGVSEEIILGILGVETYFGQRKGTYKILDALYTLGFGFPKRAKFFKSELEHFLELTNEEKLDVYNLKGSYAGAMGYCQFMPSSYRAYAKSYDVGGTRDLMDSPEDAIASIANYLKVHKWIEGQIVVSEAVKSSDAQTLKKQSLKPKYPVSHYSNLGYRPVGNISPGSVSTLIQLEQTDDMEYWFGFNNFYVITRYNHSEMYAMAVYQLAQAIDEKRQELNRLR